MQQDFSFWEFETYGKEWDICILGAGITGLSTGISILERTPHLHICILDRWFIPLGASTRNAGFSSFGSPSEILFDISQMGEAKAMEIVEQRFNGLQLLKRRLDLRRSQYEEYGGYELYNEEEFERVLQKFSYLNELMEEATKQKGVFQIVNVPEGIRGFSHCIHNTLEGQLHPGFMMEELKQRFIRLGGHIETGIEIQNIEEEDSKVLLQNKWSIPVIAKKVIVTLNAFAAQVLPQYFVHGARNHVMVTQEIPGLRWKGCFHYDEGFYYFRNIGTRILIGGARNKDFEKENTSEFGFNPVIVDALQQFLFTHLADRDHHKIEFQWSGIIGLGHTKVPIIEAVSDRVFVGLPLSGIGISLASMIGEKLAGLVLQQP